MASWLGQQVKIGKNRLLATTIYFNFGKNRLLATTINFNVGKNRLLATTIYFNFWQKSAVGNNDPTQSSQIFNPTANFLSGQRCQKVLFFY